MFKPKESHVTEAIVGLRGGAGATGKTTFFAPGEAPQWLKLAAVLTLEPGVTIGRHDHTGESELFYVLEGELYGYDQGAEILLRPGDVTLTGGGQLHELQNRSDKTARVLAVIVQE